MIVLNHKKNKVQEIRILETAIAIRFKDNIAKQLFALAEFYPDELIIWCEETYKSELNVEQFPAIFHHQKMIHSFGSIPYLNDSIGFVENSPFIKIQPEVQYPTWQLSAEVGGMYASILNAVNKEAPRDKNFNYFLVSLGKLLQPQGVFCYSNPNLLLGSRSEIQNYSTTKELFQFVKQHYKFQWTFLLLFNCVYFKRQFPIFPFLKAMFYSRRKIKFLNLDNIPIESSNTLETNFSVDVVIPTMGRKSYLFDVLKDLANQTFLPENVIIIEQNPLQESESELEYINTESWPFTIKHTFIHQTGACNARNLGLKQVTSEWVFLADDDLRMEHNFLENVCVKVKDKQDSALTFSCLQKNEQESHITPLQWSSFGSGCSIISRKSLKDINFDIRFEFGFGEDADFGMQLRNQGIDIIYVPEPSIVHLKAPMGGFRSKPVLLWDKDKIQPKPAPTILLFHIKHRTKEQLQGYKTTLFFKYYKKQALKNPFTYFRTFKKKWNKSVFWAKQLKDNI